MIMEERLRVAVTFAVSNVNTENELDIWEVIEHLEKTKTNFSATRVIEEEKKIISDNSAILVFDMSSREPCEGIAIYNCHVSYIYLYTL